MLSLAPLAHTNAESSGGSCEQLCSVIPTVKQWLEYLEKGKSRTALRLMTKQSRRAIGGFDAIVKRPRRVSAGRHVVTIASWGRHGFKAEAVRLKVRR